MKTWNAVVCQARHSFILPKIMIYLCKEEVIFLKELLSPAGNMECLKAAVLNGANAVYLGGKYFGARAYAGNFSDEEMIEAVKYAHLYGVKIYVTVNTIIYNNEIHELMKYIKYLYSIGVDALIMQDIGMISLVRRVLPDMEIHASTQCHNHNNDGIRLLKELGVTRIVLDREMSLEEIEKIDVDIEKEVFIHGALCNCYSGCCLFSFMNGGRSGNRGECTQSCRLPYKLIKNGEYVNSDSKYLLSTKELNTSYDFDKLMTYDIVSFKIEGRMKSPSYVGYVTRVYRRLMDNYGSKVLKSEEDNLKILFNRDFTSGYLFKDKVMNIESSNHRGLEIGKVIDVNDKKIKVKLYSDLYQEDGIRFKYCNKGMMANFIYDEKGLLISKAAEGDVIYLDNRIGLKDRDILVKTSSSYLDKEIISSSVRKIFISIVVKLLDDYLLFSFSDDRGNVVSDKVKVETPIKRGTSDDEIKGKLSKLGNTPFVCNDIVIDIDRDVFVNMKDINNVRRVLCDRLIDKRTLVKRSLLMDDYSLSYEREENYDMEVSLLARNSEQVRAGIAANVDRIYVDSDLYDDYRDNDRVYLRLERVNSDYDYDSKNILATEMGAIYRYGDGSCNLISDYFLNTVNNYGIKFLLDRGVKRVTLSPEVNYDYLDDYILDKVELIIYGTIENMITKSCPIRELGICPCRKDDIYYLEDINKNRYRVLHKNCLTHIMHYKKINFLDNIDYYKRIGVRSYRLELLDESYNDVIKLVSEIRK